MLGRSYIGWLLAATVLLTAGCGGSIRDEAGQVTASTTAGAFQLKVGDCTGALSTTTTVALVPCAQDHYWEAYFSKKLTDASYPGDTKITEDADKSCEAAFTAFVGVSQGKSAYEFTYYYPSEQTWNTGDDREILCFVGLKTGGVKGSLKGRKK